MPTPPVTESQVSKVLEKYSEYMDLPMAVAARKLGIPDTTLRRYLTVHAPKMGMNVGTINFETHEIADLPDDDLPVEEIIAQRQREFENKRRYEEATKQIPIKIKICGPIGILHFGDPHLDDNGTDIGAAFRHAGLTRTVEGLFGANVGDTTNGWVGRLAHLYSQQNMGRARALKVAEHFVKSARWLYMIGGNHDGWAGDDDPMKWIARQSGALYRPSEARILLQFPNGSDFTINARHDFSGHSQWNPAHGVMKSSMMGDHAELSVCGHKHVSGYGVLKSADGTICHALQVGSYKLYDRFAKEKGFRDQSLGPAALTVIDPELPKSHPDRCKVFWDVDEGVRYLKFKRG